MLFEHACFISFSRGAGKDSKFADLFFDEFVENLNALDKTMSVFKFDRCEDRRKGTQWNLWIQRELCKSAMMIAICAPNYFRGSPGCVSEFMGMENLIKSRNIALQKNDCDNWLIGLTLKETIVIEELNPYSVVEFFDCCASPERVRRVQKNRELVEKLANRVFDHWNWLHGNNHLCALEAANICNAFQLPDAPMYISDRYPHSGVVR